MKRLVLHPIDFNGIVMLSLAFINVSDYKMVSNRDIFRYYGQNIDRRLRIIKGFL